MFFVFRARTLFLIFGLFCFATFPGIQSELSPENHFHHGHDGVRETDAFANDWVVHLDSASDEVAELLALKLEYECLGEVRASTFYKVIVIKPPINYEMPHNGKSISAMLTCKRCH